MANTFLTPDVIAREALVLLQSNLVSLRLFSRNYEADLNSGAKVGDRIRIRRRAPGIVDEYNGSSINVRDIEESHIYLTLEKHFDASVKITDKERTLELVDFSEQVLAPRMVEMGEKIDSYALTKLLNAPNPVGPSEDAPAALPNSISAMALVEKTMNDLKVPMFPRYQIASSLYKATLLGVDSFVEVDKSGAEDALRRAEIGTVMSFDTFMGQNVPTTVHTSGTLTTAAVDNGAGGNTNNRIGATTIVIDGANEAAGTLLANDIVNIAGYGNVVVAANATLSSNAGSFTIKEPLRQALDDNALVTMYDGGGNDRSCHGAVFHPDAFAFVAVPLELPASAEAAYMEDPATGLAIRAVFDYDRDAKADVLSLDILVGAEMVDGRLCGQIIRDED